MSSHSHPAASPALDLSKWRRVPTILMALGLFGAGIGLLVDRKEFAYSWLLAFMFFLSLCLGSLFMVLLHHLFDASWTVPIRRFLEHIACLAPVMAALFIPIALLAPTLFPWINMVRTHTEDHALHSKSPLFTPVMFYVVSAFCFLVWWLLSSRLRHCSMRQDEDGAAVWTYRMRVLSGAGIFLFAITLTLGAIMWMKALQHQWFSTMYGVYYFAGSVWTTLATAYLITMILHRLGVLREVLHEHQYYFLGSLFLAFTIFYAYIHFSQYFIIWNANIPEETFWYVVREKGSWWTIGMIIIFGHFFLPFLVLLRIDFKEKLAIMVPLCCWAWLMHFVDLSFNILPIPHPNGFPWLWIWLQVSCLAFMGGLLAKVFLKQFAAHPPFPLKDPRLGEALGIHHPAPALSAGSQSQPHGGHR